MIDRDLLSAVRILVCHKNPASACPDGVASAIILRDALPDARVLFASHDDLTALPVEPGMLFCDISPTPERAQEFVNVGAIVLDHHRTAREVVERFEKVGPTGLGRFADEKAEPGVSGAVLAFREVHRVLVEVPDSPAIAEFARLAGIRDTWQKASPDWRAACEYAEALRFWPFERWPAHPWGSASSFARFEEMLWLGKVLVKQNEERDQRAAAEALRFRTEKGTRVAIMPGVETSDVADLLAGEVDLLIGFRFKTEALGSGGRLAMFQISTRSRSDFDCAAFCQRWKGGGGHTRAAGASFEVYPDDPNPYTFLRGEVEKYETPAAEVAF